MRSKTTLPVLGVALCALVGLAPAAQGSVWMMMTEGAGDFDPVGLTGCSLGGIGGMPPWPTVNEGCLWLYIEDVEDLIGGDEPEQGGAPSGNETGGP